jgi:hypothetical protein
MISAIGHGPDIDPALPEIVYALARVLDAADLGQAVFEERLGLNLAVLLEVLLCLSYLVIARSTSERSNFSSLRFSSMFNLRAGVGAFSVVIFSVVIPPRCQRASLTSCAGCVR